MTVVVTGAIVGCALANKGAEVDTSDTDVGKAEGGKEDTLTVFSKDICVKPEERRHEVSAAGGENGFCDSNIDADEHVGDIVDAFEVGDVCNTAADCVTCACGDARVLSFGDFVCGPVFAGETLAGACVGSGTRQTAVDDLFVFLALEVQGVLR